MIGKVCSHYSFLASGRPPTLQDLKLAAVLQVGHVTGHVETLAHLLYACDRTENTWDEIIPLLN